jgi:dihydroorotate dehydrogenase electron transfer subunit
MIQVKSRVLSNELLSEQYWKICLDAPQIAESTKPGQFVNIRIREGNAPLFRRPFSVFKLINRHGAAHGIEVIYRVVGLGTGLMTTLKRDYELDILGPLGHGFELKLDKKTHILVAGGIGSTGLFLLGEEIFSAVKKYNLQLNILLGATTKKALVLEKEFRKLNGNVTVSTDDGTYGYHGLVTQMLKNLIEQKKIAADCTIYACGPEPMYKALAEICREHNLPAQVLMERHMICGFGACLNCVCKIDKASVLKHRKLKSSHILLADEEDFGYALVCKDGPVFNIEEVIIDE